MTSDTMTRGEHTRAKIVRAAHALFLEKGYSGASMRLIASRAGIALGGIYNHFSCKEDIFAAVFGEHNPYLHIQGILQAAQGDSSEALLRDLVQRMIAMLGERPDFFNLLFIEAIEFKGSHLPVFIEHTLPKLQSFIERFETASARDRLRPLPLIVIQRAFVGMFASYAITEQLLAGLPLDHNADTLSALIDIFLHGILQPAAPAAAKDVDAT